MAGEKKGLDMNMVLGAAGGLAAGALLGYFLGGKRSSCPKPSHLDYYYFDIAGRGDTTRIALRMGDVPFNDIRAGKAELMRQCDGHSPFGQFPVMKADGVYLAQSMGLLRYAGRLSGIYPCDPLKACYVDMVMDGAEEMICHIGRSVHPGRLPECQGASDADIAAKKKLMRKKLGEEILPKHLAALSKLLTGKYFVGTSITTADLAVFNVIRWLNTGVLDGIPKDIVPKCAPRLQAHCERVMAHPKVAAYYAEFPGGKTRKVSG